MISYAEYLNRMYETDLQDISFIEKENENA